MVCSPWGVELNEDILGLIENNGVKVRRRQGPHRGLVPVLGQFLAQEVLLQLSSQEI